MVVEQQGPGHCEAGWDGSDEPMGHRRANGRRICGNGGTEEKGTKRRRGYVNTGGPKAQYEEDMKEYIKAERGRKMYEEENEEQEGGKWQATKMAAERANKDLDIYYYTYRGCRCAEKQTKKIYI